MGQGCPNYSTASLFSSIWVIAQTAELNTGQRTKISIPGTSCR